MVFASGAWAAEVANFEQLKEAFNADGTYELTEDITISENITTVKNVTLDLKGHTISTVEGDWKNFVTIFIGDGTNAGNLILKNTVPASGGILFKTKAAGSKTASSLKVIGDISKSIDGRKTIKSTLTVNDGVKITSEGYFCLRVFGLGATLNILGGNITARQDSIDSVAITGNGLPENGGTEINISGGNMAGSNVVDPDSVSGKESSGCAIYHPQDGVLNISGGTLTGYDGIQLKAGRLNMTGGSIKAAGASIDPTPNYNGSVATGSALSLITCSAYTGNINASISGAAKLETTGKGTYAIYEKIIEETATSTSTKLKNLSISGGTLIGTAGAFSLENKGDAAKITLTGGTYSSDPSDYVDKAISTIVEKDGLFTVKGKAAPIVTPVEPKLPDGTSDDVKAEIKPATAVVLGVDTTKSAITEETKAAAITDTMKVISADITSKDLTVNEETGAVEIAVATASEAAKGLLKDNETLASKDIAPLPVFTATVDEGKTAMVSYQLTGSALKAKTAEEVRVMKILSSTTAGEFEYASEITADMDGKFTIQNTDGKIYSGALEADTKYLLTLFIKDGSSFDLDGAENGSITDPAAIFSTTTTEPQHGSSSSGCNGGFGALALLGLALVPMFYGKKR